MARLARLVVPDVPLTWLEAGDLPPEEKGAIESPIRTGRPRGEAFIGTLESLTGRALKRRKPVRKPEAAEK
jgi:hypothetical protein